MTILERPLYMQDLEYPARLDRGMIDELFSEGVMQPGDFKVTQRGLGANMSVDVAAGGVVVTGDDTADQGKYFTRNPSLKNLAIAAAHASLPRLDLVVVRMDDSQEQATPDNQAVLAVITGTPNAAPVAPAVPLTCLALARILVPAASTTVVTANITDLRPVVTMLPEDNRKVDKSSLKLLAGTLEYAVDTVITEHIVASLDLVIKPASGKVVTLAGGITAGMYKIFDLSAGGTVVVNKVPEVYPHWWGATGANTGDDTIPLTQAAAAAKAAQVTLAIPDTGVCYKVTGEGPEFVGPLVIEGQGSILNNVGHAARVKGIKLHVHGVTFVSGSGGYTIKQSGLLAQSHWDEVTLVQHSADQGVWDNDGQLLIEVWYSHFDFVQVTTTSSVHQFLLVTNNGDINCNVFEKGRLTHSGTVQFFRLESTSSVQYVYDNVFREINCEILKGGFAWLGGDMNTRFESCWSYDTALMVTDWISMGHGAGGLRTEAPEFKLCMRRSTTLTGGVWMLKNRGSNQSRYGRIDRCSGTGGGGLFNCDISGAVGFTHVEGLFDSVNGLFTSIGEYVAAAGLVLESQRTTEAAIQFLDIGTIEWQIYKILTDPVLYLRDMLNGRTQMSFEGGADSATALTRLFSRLVAHSSLEVLTNGEGVLLHSPDGTRWRVAVDNAGVITPVPA